MIKITILMVLCLIFAQASEKHTRQCQARGLPYYARNDGALWLLILALSLFSGLRTSYNDTWNYISDFRSDPGVAGFLADPENLNPFKNPLFYFYQSILKDLTGNPQHLIFTTSVFSQVCFVRFFKHYSQNFTFTVFLYFTLGTFSFTLAAMKQVVAMSVLTLAFPALQQRRWGRYYLLVVIAMLFHTYAIAFAVLPLFTQRPWSVFTYLFVSAMVVLMMNFEQVITEFMEQANDLGKTLADYELFDSHTINVFRLFVYAVPPIISFVFQRWIIPESTRTNNILIHMSIISLAFMSMGTQSGANMFGRMSTYFELGTLCCLPDMMAATFEQRSHNLVRGLAIAGFLGFFIYANAINSSFDDGYRAISIFELVFS